MTGLDTNLRGNFNKYLTARMVIDMFSRIIVINFKVINICPHLKNIKIWVFFSKYRSNFNKSISLERNLSGNFCNTINFPQKIPTKCKFSTYKMDYLEISNHTSNSYLLENIFQLILNVFFFKFIEFYSYSKVDTVQVILVFE